MEQIFRAKRPPPRVEALAEGNDDGWSRGDLSRQPHWARSYSQALAGRAFLAGNWLARAIALLRDATWTKNGNLSRCLVLAGVLLVMFLRAPHFFLAPRLWAEEGRLFYSNAFHYAHTNLWYKGLSYVLGGYLDLWANLATTVAANCASVENAPRVTLSFAVVSQLLPFVILLWSDSPFWQSPMRKAAGVFILLFAPLSGEIWLATNHGPEYLALSGFMVLMEDAPASAVKRWGYRLVLLFAGLTGPGTCIMAPVFLLKAWRERSKQRLVQGVVLSLCASVQVSLLHLFPEGFRHGAINPAIYFLSLWSQSVGMVLLGVRHASSFGAYFSHLHEQGDPRLLSAVVACAIAVAAIVFFVAKGVPRRDRWVLVGTYLLLTFVTHWGSLGDETYKWNYVHPCCGQRYFYVPNVIFLLLILARCGGPMRPGRIVATFALFISLGFAIAQYRGTLCQTAPAPNWKQGVRAWREDPTRTIEIPPNGWYADLRSTYGASELKGCKLHSARFQTAP